LSVSSGPSVSDSASKQLPLGQGADETVPLSSPAVVERFDWLSFHRVWGLLAEGSLRAIAQSLQLLTVEPGTEIYRQDQAAIGLYLSNSDSWLSFFGHAGLVINLVNRE